VTDRYACNFILMRELPFWLATWRDGFWCEYAMNCRSPHLIDNYLTWSANIRPSTWWEIWWTTSR